MHCALVALLVAVTALSGCSDVGPDAVLPGVTTESQVSDEFRCGELLFAAGCVIVRIPHVDSGCVPEIPGYVVCNATVFWSATSGAVAPQTRLRATVNGTAAGSCTANPGATCSLEGNATFTHSFSGPGEEHAWTVVVAARADAPGDPGPMTGDFTLTVNMLVRTEEPSAADV